nr:PREDICTED: heparan-sulfate 6-O-sulfotransferase 2-like [Lepisosteus oculatus]
MANHSEQNRSSAPSRAALACGGTDSLPALLPLRNYYYITILRDPVSRYLSEWRHVQRGATWKASLHVCDGRAPTSSELPSCYTGDDWSGCTLEEFMGCPHNLANNRQARMLADLSLVGCYNLTAMSEEARGRVLLDSAKRNLQGMAFFGLTEFQRKTQYLFERTFRMAFISPFTQLNSTRASGVEVAAAAQARIRRLNGLDVELYDFARDLFLQRFRFARQQERNVAVSGQAWSCSGRGSEQEMASSPAARGRDRIPPTLASALGAVLKRQVPADDSPGNPTTPPPPRSVIVTIRNRRAAGINGDRPRRRRARRG